ncbi:MAG: ankyrin repeat domain-containing protein [Campylobacteraceae bacterium]
MDEKDKKLEELKQKIAKRKQAREEKSSASKNDDLLSLPNFMKNKFVATIAIIIVASIIIVFIQRHFEITANVPEHKIKLTQQGNSLVANKGFSLQNGGCYEVGLYNTKGLFVGILMKSPNYTGDYKLTYSVGKHKTKNGKMNQDAKYIGFTGVGGTNKHSMLRLDEIELPLNARSINIALEISNLDSIFIENKKDLFLYLEETNSFCGETKKHIEDRRIISPENDDQLASLYDAIKNHNQVALEEFFTKTNLPFNVKMKGDKTALHYAAYFNNPEAIAYLIKNDSSILNMRDNTNRTAFIYAVGFNKVNAVKELLKYIDIKSVEKDNFSVYGAEEGDVDEYDFKSLPESLIDSKIEPIIEMLLEAGMNPNLVKVSIRDREDRTIYVLTTMLDIAKDQQKSYEYSCTQGKTSSACNGIRYKDYSKAIKILEKYGAKTYKDIMNYNKAQIAYTKDVARQVSRSSCEVLYNNSVWCTTQK